ncbi:leucine-rich repeat protein [Paenibacillus sp. MER 99-2]|uniref:leucine-rich repeat protein n=1 Tax=Paenibacillus sp. MER 99-2 TaxID=2939572 RepID=UPI00203F5465|nr:leucine-rich repeat protein [Paenibacillus sp. MER 99-2]MCM3174086.1 leucine-rich repeat protein [Paenibacillus sp. MER 99-2]
MKKIVGLMLAVALLVSPISFNKANADMPSEFTYTESNSMATITGYTGSSSDIIIPDEIDGYPVTAIGNEAFRSKRLTSVTIPEGVLSIGSSAFHSNNLTSVTIPNSITSISDRVFASNNIVDLVIPDSVTSIGDYAFSSNNLSNVTLSNHVALIGTGAFFYNNLTSIILPSGLTSLSPSVFMSNKLTNVVIPDGVTSIGNGAFHSNELISVTIPDSVTTIKEDAFSQNKLVNVSIPNSVTSIERDAFSYNKLVNVTIPNGVTSIASGVFSSNELTSITLPDHLTVIGYNAFNSNKLTNVTIPASVTSIDSYAFASNSLNTITFEGSLPSLDASVVASQTKPNYTFENWYSDETLQAAWDFTNSIDPNTTFYSKYIPDKLTVSFNSNGGSQVADLADITYDTTITAPVAPTRSGYVFGGWYVDQVLTTTWNFDTDKVTENKTLFAKWTAINNPPVVPPVTSPAPVTSPVVPSVTTSVTPAVVEQEIEDTENIESEQEPEAPVEKYFTDIDGHWAENSINKLAQKGILKGYENGQFGPNDFIQRHHLALLINRLVKLDAVREAVNFEDVPTKHPSYSAILNLQQGGVIDGYKNSFNPSGQLTLGELAKILVQAFNIKQAKITGENKHWSYIYTQTLSELEIMKAEDIENGVNKPVTRALLADVLYRLLQYKQLI